MHNPATLQPCGYQPDSQPDTETYRCPPLSCQNVFDQPVATTGTANLKTNIFIFSDKPILSSVFCLIDMIDKRG